MLAEKWSQGAGLEESLDGEEELFKGEAAQTISIGGTESNADFGSSYRDSPTQKDFVQEEVQPQEVQHPPEMKEVLALVEGFLLPEVDMDCPWWKGEQGGSAETAKLRPESRLCDVLYQVALADQIRSFQTMYRDNFDEHRLFSELRAIEQTQLKEQKKKSLADMDLEKYSTFSDEEDPDAAAKKKRDEELGPVLPTKALMVKIIEGRIRIGALCRLCYGDDSVESLKASIDLASSYATQGMWEQVVRARLIDYVE